MLITEYSTSFKGKYSKFMICHLMQFNVLYTFKIIKSYNPDDYEENRISNTFIENLAQKLNNRGGLVSVIAKIVN